MGAARRLAAAARRLASSAADSAAASVRRLASSAAAAAPPSAPAGLVFDIDGVLRRGGATLPAARRALAALHGPGGRARLPFAFLTNGGGMLEADKAAQLAGWLGVPVAPTQVLLSHTPFRALAPRFADLPVLVAGRGRVAEVAAAYGFRRAATTAQLAAAAPRAVPFRAPAAAAAALSATQPPAAADPLLGSEAAPFRAVFVFNDPPGEEWYSDLQLLVDVIAGGGVLGRRPDHGRPGPPVEVFFSNPDLLWANEWPAPRFGQGAFGACLAALHAAAAGRPLRATTFGKPGAEAFHLALGALRAHAAALGHRPWPAPGGLGGDQLGADSDDSNGAAHPPVYMVGDNPAADVRGANAAGAPWVSVLVRSGVFAGGANCAVDPAHLVVHDVEEAVEVVLERERARLCPV
jgi:HAD superfamily hydrolase (TIGR01456 family)